MLNKVCEVCGKEFKTYKKTSRFCSKVCGDIGRKKYSGKKCIICGKEFYSSTPSKKYCSRECYYKGRVKYEDRICLICGKSFHPELPTQKYCSHKCLGLAQRKREESTCPVCGKSFYSSNNKNQKYCSKECYTKYQTTIEEKECETCGKIFKGRGNFTRFCSRSCWDEYMHNEPIDQKAERMKRLRESNPDKSKTNLEYKNKLEKLGFSVDDEFNIEDKFYDLKVGDILLEINPWISHTSTPGYKYGAKKQYYHKYKTKVARRNGYRCIMFWDWDDWNKIVNILLPKQTIYARNCVVKEIDKDVTNSFLNTYHLQNSLRHKKSTIYLGLYYKEELVMVIVFGKPRYNNNYEIELLRLCTHKDYTVVGGASKIFKYYINNYKPNSIISYCDMSKFDGRVYEQLGFKLNKWNKPSKHWWNIKNNGAIKHITGRELNKKGFDQLLGKYFGNYGKGTNNEELMRLHGYVEIYDCGQATFVWTRE